MKIKVRRKMKVETQDNLEERYNFLSGLLKDKNTDEATRQAVITEMTFIKSQFPEKKFKPIEAGGIIAAIISALAMAGVGMAKYHFENRGMYSKSGDNMLDERNYKKL